MLAAGVMWSVDSGGCWFCGKITARLFFPLAMGLLRTHILFSTTVIFHAAGVILHTAGSVVGGTLLCLSAWGSLKSGGARKEKK
ncbi:hypothetical protein GCM10023260_12570 [Bartonella acomydis]|uniref:Uncharacterized protein n=2 Tax=Bartonella acomydis TaxID=686234 RepID=A0ABP9MSP3_9HYPH